MSRNIELIKIRNNSSVPKYRQIIDSIVEAVREGTLKQGDPIPSLNTYVKVHGLSQDTVLTAYNELKNRNIITSQVGKGYYVKTNTVREKHRVFLLFDKLTAYKETLYESFKLHLAGKGTEQIFFHHNNLKAFETWIADASGNYTDYVIMPMRDKRAIRCIRRLSRPRVVILDLGRDMLTDAYAGIYQNFSADLYNALASGLDQIRKYQRMILVMRHSTGHFADIRDGFSRFCTDHEIESAVLSTIGSGSIQPGEVYVVVDDHDLVELVKIAGMKMLGLGSQIGLISYNDTPLKEIIAGGVTVVSTDFGKMGETLADMIISGKKTSVDNPSRLIIRNTL